jgi:hypothetical protein
MHAHVSVRPAETPADPTMQRTRAAGIAIAAATIISTIFVAMDHSGGGSNALEVLQGIARLQVLKEVVHGVAIASVCAYAFGYTTLARRLGLQRPVVLAGLTVYLLGCVAMIGATILDGFVTTHIAMSAITGSPEKIKFAYSLVYFISVVLNDLAKLGWILQAVATLAWSIALLHGRGFDRAIGVIGFVSSGLVVALIAASDVNMTMTSLLSVLFAQLIWNLAAAAMLLRDPNRVTQRASMERQALAS